MRFCLYCLFRCCFSYLCLYVCFSWLSLGNLFIRKMETFLRPPSYYRLLCRQNSLQGINTFTDFDIVSLMGWRHDICYWELQDKTVKGKIRSSKLLLFSGLCFNIFLILLLFVSIFLHFLPFSTSYHYFTVIAELQKPYLARHSCSTHTAYPPISRPCTVFVGWFHRREDSRCVILYSIYRFNRANELGLPASIFALRLLNLSTLITALLVGEKMT